MKNESAWLYTAWLIDKLTFKTVIIYVFVEIYFPIWSTFSLIFITTSVWYYFLSFISFSSFYPQPSLCCLLFLLFLFLFFPALARPLNEFAARFFSGRAVKMVTDWYWQIDDDETRADCKGEKEREGREGREVRDNSATCFLSSSVCAHKKHKRQRCVIPKGLLGTKR